MTYSDGVLNILVIEDHIGDYILIEDYLSEEHLQINLTRATTFKEAKENLSVSHKFKVILLDLSLPDVESNEDLVTRMVSLAPNTPIIVLTGFANKQFGVKTLSLGISDYLLNGDAFVLSSLWEGLPISLLEAISFGVIPVCTPAGGIPDVIKNDTLGYVSSDFTERGLYGAVLKCINNMDLFNRQELKNYFIDNFSMEKCSMSYQKVYKDK